MAETVFLVLGLMVMTTSLVGFTLAWWKEGREPRIREAAVVLTTPPADLAPGLAGVLVDETVHDRQVLATLLELARRGVIRFHESGPEGGLAGIGTSIGHDIEVIDPAVPLRPYEDAILFAIFGQSGRSRLHGHRVSLGPGQVISVDMARAIARALYDELIVMGYYTRSPMATRRKWYVKASWFSGLVLAGILLLAWTVGPEPDELGRTAVVATVLMIVTSVVFPYGIAAQMAARTKAGAEAAAGWNAFRRHLTGADWDASPPLSRESVASNLPHAVGLGVERQFLQACEEHGIGMPEWFGGDHAGFRDMCFTASQVMTSRTSGGRTFAE